MDHVCHVCHRNAPLERGICANCEANNDVRFNQPPQELTTLLSTPAMRYYIYHTVENKIRTMVNNNDPLEGIIELYYDGTGPPIVSYNADDGPIKVIFEYDVGNHHLDIDIDISSVMVHFDDRLACRAVCSRMYN